MAQLQIVYWRDIPAQVVVRKGRKTLARRQLPERFEQAIDRCAMKVGAKDSEAYLAEWRRGDPVELGPVELGSGAEADPEETATQEAARLDREYGSERIKALIVNGGRDG